MRSSSAVSSTVAVSILLWMLHLLRCATGEAGTRYSVIVVRENLHNSNLFADSSRVNAYTEGEVSVQFAKAKQPRVFERGVGQPFGVGHLPGRNKRVRIIHTWDLLGDHMQLPLVPVLSESSMSHLQGACEDISETTILRVKHDKPAELRVIWQTPSACWSNVVVTYPYNIVPGIVSDVQLPSFHPDLRLAFVPLGTMDGFPFIEALRRRPTPSRRLFANLVARTDTSVRREQLLNITLAYERQHPDLQMLVGPPRMNSSDFQEILLDSQFTVTPRGLHPETFRMHEALEAGSIPIVSKADFLSREENNAHARDTDVGIAAWNTVAASPFARVASVETWDGLPALLDKLAAESPEAIAKLQADCLRWYEELMRRTYTSLLHFGDGQDFFPQNGPIVLPGFSADTKG